MVFLAVSLSANNSVLRKPVAKMAPSTDKVIVFRETRRICWVEFGI